MPAIGSERPSKASKVAKEVALQDPLTALPGIGPTTAARLQALGLYRVEDLLFHLPSRYQDRRFLTALASLQAGMETAVLAEVVAMERLPGRRPQWRFSLRDGTGSLAVRFFHLTPYQRQQWRIGRRFWCFGEVRAGQGSWEMIHPEWESADRPDFRPPEHLTPFYPSTAGIHQQQWRRFLQMALALLPSLEDPLAPLLPGWLPLSECLRQIHQGTESSPEHVLPYRRRLALEELLAHHLALRRARQQNAPLLQRPRPVCDHLWQKLLRTLPFQPTPAQERVIAEIVADLGKEQPMRRLLQGDVGSGKTLVAVATILHAVAMGMQVALMAPTEILAKQLQEQLEKWLRPLSVAVGSLTGSLASRERQAVLGALATGELAVLCGTQALFQEGVTFAHLGLVIIDEQHRFGVDQRRKLLEKGRLPHLLVMTATPIPRSLAMTLHADLDLSIIDALPPGRQPIETLVLSDHRRVELIERLRGLLQQGRQIYWVCPLIEESELLALQAAEASFRQLQEALPEFPIALIHGRQRVDQKNQSMEAFRRGDVQILVATTVIEVGVDVPNASVMVIENAERLGLAQLHQLRGRVGRGTAQSLCLLLYRGPLSVKARERLQIMRDSQDGFVIARKDLEMRGPGEFLGIRQSGEFSFRVADLLRDEDLLALLPDLASALERQPKARDVVLERWLGKRLQGYGAIG